jgi:hypothetical protein
MADARAEITALVFGYAERIDAGDLDGLAALFTDGVFRSDRGGRYEGATAVRDVMRRLVVLHDDGTPRTKHVTTNLVIDVDEAAGTAVSHSVYVMLQQTDELPLQVIDAGRNRDSFTKVDGEWQWTERYINVELHGDLSHHLFMDTTPFA